MYAEVLPYLHGINDIKDIVKRIEKRSGSIMLNAVIDVIEKHDLHHEDGTVEQKAAIDKILNTLPAHLQEQYNPKALPTHMVLKA